jgi:two-component system nitrate/nitrite response regulator NarL
LLVDDDPLVGEWIKHALSGSPFRLVGEASDANAAVALIDRHKPEVLLIDYRLGDLRGTQFLRDLRLSGVQAVAILMSAGHQPGLNEAAREASAQGTLLKSIDASELLSVLRVVAEGGSSFDRRHPLRPAGERALSSREREVLRLLADGATNRQISTALVVTPETVKTLVNRLFGKLGVHSRAAAVTAGHERGLL